MGAGNELIDSSTVVPSSENVQLTLEQHRFELCGSSKGRFFLSKYCQYILSDDFLTNIFSN